MNAEQVIKNLDLQSHFEGGYYKRTWHSELSINQESLPSNYKSKHYLASSILYLLKDNQISKLHCLNSDEIWTFISGQPLILHLFNQDNSYQQIILGLDFNNNQLPQYCIKAETFFAAELKIKKDYTLVSCFVSPEFKPEDFAFAEIDKLSKRFINHQDLIYKLCKK
jgi:hypothetical protein